MALPSGYTKLEYIESDNSAWLDTGITMEKTDTVTLEAVYSTAGTSDVRYFGANGYMQIAVTSGGYSINGTAKKALGTKDEIKCAYTPNTESLYVNNSLIDTNDWSSYNGVAVKIGLFKMGDASNGWFPGKAANGKLYRAVVTKNGATVRIFTPCKNANGIAGMWDEISSTFFQSASSFAFTAGPEVKPDLTAHKTLVNGTAYTVKGGKCMVDGTVYNILKGRTLIDGTGYDITFPSAGRKIETLNVGQSVYANVGGVRKEFIVVHQGKPSSMYDESCNGTWLLMKDIYESRQWHSSNVNYLEYSTIHSYLNSTFLNLFESNIRDAIKQVKIPYRKNSGFGSSDQSGANGLPAKIFLLSGYEVGWTTSDNQNFPVDGAKLSYFEAGTGTSANNKRVANLDGSVFFWWLRSPYASGNVWRVSPNGLYDSSNASSSNGIRPALVLRSDALVDDEFNIIS